MTTRRVEQDTVVEGSGEKVKLVDLGAAKVTPCWLNWINITSKAPTPVGASAKLALKWLGGWVDVGEEEQHHKTRPSSPIAVYSRTPPNPYPSVTAPGYGLWEGMEFKKVPKNRSKKTEKIRKNSKKYI